VEHFRQAGALFGASIISIGFGKAVKVNPTKSKLKSEERGSAVGEIKIVEHGA
jgi:hypothetical protein